MPICNNIPSRDESPEILAKSYVYNHAVGMSFPYLCYRSDSDSVVVDGVTCDGEEVESQVHEKEWVLTIGHINRASMVFEVDTYINIPIEDGINAVEIIEGPCVVILTKSAVHVAFSDQNGNWDMCSHIHSPSPASSQIPSSANTSSQSSESKISDTSHSQHPLRLLHCGLFTTADGGPCCRILASASPESKHFHGFTTFECSTLSCQPAHLNSTLRKLPSNHLKLPDYHALSTSCVHYVSTSCLSFSSRNDPTGVADRIHQPAHVLVGTNTNRVLHFVDGELVNSVDVGAPPVALEVSHLQFGIALLFVGLGGDQPMVKVYLFERNRQTALMTSIPGLSTFALSDFLHPSSVRRPVVSVKSQPEMSKVYMAHQLFGVLPDFPQGKKVWNGKTGVILTDLVRTFIGSLKVRTEQ